MIEYWSTADIGQLFGVSAAAVTRWVERYTNFPPADAVVGTTEKGRMFGWLPARESDIRAWNAARPGQGARTDLKGDNND